MLRLITLVYLLTPYFIFFLGWLRIGYSLILTGLLAYSMIQLFRNDRDNTEAAIPSYKTSFILILLTIVLGWTALSGAGGIGYQNSDHTKHNSILNDLITLSWPVHYPEGVPVDQGMPSTLVYSLAFYLPASLIGGKAFGWQAANVALFLWAYIGFTLTFVWFIKLVGKHSLWLPVIFIFAGGLDFVGHLLLSRKLMLGTDHIEWWAGQFQYSSNSKLLVWVPQHAIGGWLSTALILYQLISDRDCKFLGLSLVAGWLWSPFVTVGLVPFAILAMFKKRFSRLFSFPNIASFIVAIVIAVYYSGAIHPPPQSLWTFQDFLRFWPRLFLFLILEVAIYFYLCFNSQNLMKQEEKVILAISALTLFLIPFFRAGLHNDWAMRASIPALFVLWIFVARAFFNKATSQGLLVSRVLIFFFTIGSFTGFAELARSIANYSIYPPSQESLTPTPQYLSEEIAEQYMGNPDAFFFRYLARSNAATRMD